MGIEDYKAELEQEFYELTEVQLQIGSMRAGLRGFNPELILYNIDTLSVDGTGQPALQLQDVRLGVNALDLLFSGDFLSSSWLTLVGVKVAVIRQEDGSISIKGLNAGNNEQPLWLSRGGKYEILQSEISWLDKKRHGEMVIFNNFDLLIKNDNGRHEIHLLSDLPEQYGKSLRISANFEGNVILADDKINGKIYLEGNGFHFAELVTGDLPYGIKFNKGSGSFKLWSDWRDSKLVNVAGNIYAQDMHIERGSGKSLALDKLDSGLSWSSTTDGWQFRVYDLKLEAMQKQWPVANFQLFTAANGNTSALIQQLDLHEISYLTPFFLDKETSESLPKDLMMAGVIQDFAVYVSEDFKRFALNGSFSGFETDSSGALPQLQGLSGQIRGTHERGKLELASYSGRVFFKDLFRSALDFDRIEGTVNWEKKQQTWGLESENFAVENADFHTSSKFNILIPEHDQPVFMDLQMAFEGVSDVTHVPRYLPAKIMSETVVDWLDTAFLGGHISDGEFLLSGNLNEFPFTDSQGEFEVQFNVDNGMLSYHPEWPVLTKLDAEVQFFADSLEVRLRHAQSEQVTIKQAVVEIPELSAGDLLLVNGVLQGNIADGLLFMQKTPLHSNVDGVLAATEILGETDVDLSLQIPLSETVQEKVNGVIHVQNASLKVKSIELQVDKLNGDLRFTEQGLFCRLMDGKLLGFPAKADITTDRESTRISISGASNTKNLQRQFPFLQNDFIQGDFSYTTLIDLPVVDGKDSSVVIASDLQGVKVGLPGMLMKTAKQKKPLRLTIELPEGNSMPIYVNYDDQLKIALQFNKLTETVDSGHILYGQGQAQALADAKPGLKLDIKQPVFDVSDWSGFISEGDQKGSKLPEFNEINIDLGQMIWNGQSLGSLELAIKRLGQNWQGSLSNSAMKGALKIPAGSLGGKKIFLQMAHLDLSRLSELKLPVSFDSTQQFPLIEIHSEKLLWEGIDLGHLQLQTERQKDGVFFKKIKLSGRNSDIEMTADWLRSEEGDSSTQLKGRLTSADFGRFLGSLGYNDDLKETAAIIDFEGSWEGAPHQFALADLQGEMQLDLKKGRISSIEPGFGRLLGLIAMEQWVKRFTLDFRDVYEKGLAFNSIKGRFTIKDGQALTNDLLIDAIAARAKITGEADLLEKTLNHRVLVVPKSSDAVPIAGTIVGGIASVVTQIFTNDYKEGYFFGSEYKVKGKWGDAEITPLHDRDGLLKKTWSELTDFPWLKSAVN